MAVCGRCGRCFRFVGMKIFYAPEALADLQNIKESVIEKFADAQLAEQVLRTIMKSIQNLEIFPGMGTELSLDISGDTGYRYLFVKKNYIFYRTEKNNIYIVRILNEKQDYTRILFGVAEEKN